MYSSCIFCNAALGANEVLEAFPVGRRVAYDEAMGRLWVVCRMCERWNLSPFETRWEAIEEAERVFRATPLKVTGENIGLAQTNEGLELVRIGKPPMVELMAWRYGDQFGRRRRRHVIAGGGIATAAVGFGALSFASSSMPWVLAAVFGVVQAHSMLSAGKTLRRKWGPKWTFVADDDGKVLRLNYLDIGGSAVVSHATGGWSLAVIHHVWRGEEGKGALVNGFTELHGEHAERALSRILPLTNREGGSRKQVQEAVSTIAGANDFNSLLRHTVHDLEPGKQHMAALEPRTRLALEMALHGEEEQRAMEGELATLASRWREADALAKIADSLFVPPEVEKELERIRKEVDSSE
jgi:hypothetical protein